ncbi:MAG TPA: isocitrate/isopropylmalate dehydrogenase family protein [Myxococcaceae bacterium]|nr:isocitrate/isopropylmalate dehydrogenase family protein [Myxococcaceae bacterium]
MPAARRVSVIPGDGIGPEVVGTTVRVLQALDAPLEFEYCDAGAEAFKKHGTNLPRSTVESVMRTRVGLKGPTGTSIGTGPASANVALRKELDLYANLRPVKSLPNVKTRFDQVDLVVVRENTEDLYAGLEHIVVPGVVESLKVITERASLRIARFAFEFARKQSRKKISAVHKANIMKLSDGLFLECCRRVAREYPEILYEEVIVDNLCMQLVINPNRYDVLLLENLYGDIVSDLCAGLVGGLGVVPGANLGERCAVFEAVHGTAPDIAGKGIANPTAMMLSAVMMLRWLDLPVEAERLERGLMRVYERKEARTRDLGGTASTQEFASAVVAAASVP